MAPHVAHFSTAGVQLLQWLLAECQATPGGTCIPVFVGHNIKS
jgi:hypothetical protein